MDKQLSSLIELLKSINKVVEAAEIDSGGFHAHGWDQTHLKKEDLECYIDNYISKLQSYGDAPITAELGKKIENHIRLLTDLKVNLTDYLEDQASYLIHIVPNTLLTLNTVFSDIDYELFSYENIQNNKLLPKSLSTRLRGASAQLDSIDETSSSLEEKIKVINEAHSAAESLPTDLASLQEAKMELNNLIRKAADELSSAKKEIEALKVSSIKAKNDAEKANEEAWASQLSTKNSADAAAKLVVECDDALQITTTQGLAAGFDQKAKELKNSIWVWIGGLLLALGVGAWIGGERVDAFTIILTNDLTAGQAILHTIMSVFSIGGPLWLAWISTQQINQRFKLSEDYSYKATVAKAFTGFKKFAERFDPSTEERLFNSTLDRLDEMPLRLIEGKDYNSPWHEFIDSESFKAAITMLPGLAKEAGKFANKTSLKTKTKQKIQKAEAEQADTVIE